MGRGGVGSGLGYATPRLAVCEETSVVTLGGILDNRVSDVKHHLLLITVNTIYIYIHMNYISINGNYVYTYEHIKYIYIYTLMKR